MMAANDSLPLERRLRIAAPASDAELSGLRRQTVSFVQRNGGDADLAADLALVVSELSTNVMRHTVSDVVVVVMERTDADWVIEVSSADAVPDLGTLSTPDPSDVAGRGLLVVAALTDSAEVLHSDGGSVIRCRRSAIA